MIYHKKTRESCMIPSKMKNIHLCYLREREGRMLWRQKTPNIEISYITSSAKLDLPCSHLE